MLALNAALGSRDLLAPTAWPPQLVRLSAMVVKTGVGLGQMSDADRQLALALPAWRLSTGHVAAEAHVNELLRASLGAESAFLRTDHVELRRWLVDTGWWQRDGYGRAYTRPAATELPYPLRAIAEALEVVEPAAWAMQQVDSYRSAQRKRRARWSDPAERAQGAQAGQPGPAYDTAPKSGRAE